MIVGVYGLGRFGFFWSKILSNKFKVKAFSRNSERPLPENVERCTFLELMECDIIFLCVSISAVEEVLLSMKNKVKPGSIIADTCSVKVYPTELMQQIMPKDNPLLGTHPMFGPDSGKDGVKGLPLVFSPIRMSEEDSEFWKNSFTALELDVVCMTPHQHDKEAAYTQGITHFIGRTLSDLNLKQSNIGTKGYHSLLEIMEQTCNDPWQLFLDLQSYNPYTKDMRKDLVLSFNKILKDLKDPHYNSGLKIEEGLC